MNIGCPNNSDSPNAARGVDNPPRKKLRLSKEQSRLLEESFRQNHTLNPKQKEELAETLQLRPRQVEVWFQNRRARSKLKQTEIEYKYLKRWFGLLTERNQKLHNEVDELRGMKVGQVEELPAHGNEPLLISSLTMCPRCERVSTVYAKKPTSGPNSTTPSRIKQLLCNNVDNPSPLLSDN
ncbi:unnamed protein product [Rhodiola kirilowii]